MSKIAEGYPKLAQYIGQDLRHVRFPNRYNDWGSLVEPLNSGEIVVIANVSMGGNFYYFVPFRLLENKLVPLQSVLSWTRSYKNLPGYRIANFKLIDKAWIDGQRAA